MILKMQPLNLAKAKELAGNLDEKKELRDYLKKFGKFSKSNPEKLAEDILKLDNLKLKEEHIMKIIDFAPETAEDMNKIFSDVSLNEKEINDILEIVKKY